MSSNQITLRQINYFLAVAQFLHYRQAAESLYITQPGLSRQIQLLEESLGLLLFERHNRQVKLTRAGAYFAERWRTWQNELNHILEQGRMIHEGTAGTLSFGYVASAMQNVLPDLLVNIREMLPAVSFDLKEMTNQAQIESLLNDEIDLAFIRSDRVPHELIIKPYHEDTFSGVFPSDHPMNAQTFHSLDQLRDEHFILFEPSYSTYYYQTIMSLFEETDFSPRISHTSVHASTIFRLVEKGFGISIVPSSLQLGYAMDVKFLSLEAYRSRAVIFLARRRNIDHPVLSHLIEAAVLP